MERAAAAMRATAVCGSAATSATSSGSSVVASATASAVASGVAAVAVWRLAVGDERAVGADRLDDAAGLDDRQHRVELPVGGLERVRQLGGRRAADQLLELFGGRQQQAGQGRRRRLLVVIERIEEVFHPMRELGDALEADHGGGALEGVRAAADVLERRAIARRAVEDDQRRADGAEMLLGFEPEDLEHFGIDVFVGRRVLEAFVAEAERLRAEVVRRSVEREHVAERGGERIGGVRRRLRVGRRDVGDDDEPLFDLVELRQHLGAAIRRQRAADERELLEDVLGAPRERAELVEADHRRRTRDGVGQPVGGLDLGRLALVGEVGEQPLPDAGQVAAGLVDERQQNRRVALCTHLVGPSWVGRRRRSRRCDRRRRPGSPWIARRPCAAAWSPWRLRRAA